MKRKSERRMRWPVSDPNAVARVCPECGGPCLASHWRAPRGGPWRGVASAVAGRRTAQVNPCIRIALPSLSLVLEESG